MAGKPAFTDAQIRILRDTAKKLRKKFKNQEEFALALGITQPSLSSLMSGKWKPGVTTARAIAHLDKTTLEELVGPYASAPSIAENGHAPMAAYPNLEACLRFYSGTRSWSAWTLAAARAGFWGAQDLPPPEWPERLDALEKGLEKLRKASASSP